MSTEQTEIQKRIAGIIGTLQQKRADFEKAQSDINRLFLIRDKTEEDLSQVRRQLMVEILKLDPAMQFFEKEAREAVNA